MKKNYKKGLALTLPLLLLAVFGVWMIFRTEKPQFIYLMSGIRGNEDFPMFQSFEEEVRSLGGEPKILDFDENENSSIRQIQMLKEAVTKNTACIVVNGYSNGNLAERLKEYRKKGIKILASQGEIAPEYRELYIGAVNLENTGELMMEEAARSCGAQGKFVIVSETPRSVFGSDLILKIRYTFEEHRYPEMVLSNILYGYGEDSKIGENIKDCLTETPDVKVLLCLSERVTQKACEAVRELGVEEQTAVIGFGKPESLEEFKNDEKIRLELLYCDMLQYGRLVAQLAEKLVSGECMGKAGETVELGGKSYVIEADIGLAENDASGSQIWMYDAYERWASEAF